VSQEGLIKDKLWILMLLLGTIKVLFVLVLLFFSHLIRF